MTVSQMNELLERAGSSYKVSEGDAMGPEIVALITALLDRIEELESRN